MTLSANIRSLQDRRRNAGWRIRWVAGRETGPRRPWVRSRTAAMAAILAAAGVALHGAIALIGIAPMWTFALTAGLCSVPIVCLWIAVRQYGRRWVAVRGICIDHEIRKVRRPRSRPAGGGAYRWEYRLLCEFELGGRRFRTTPQTRDDARLTSKHAITGYIDTQLAADGSCRLWVDRQNPYHCYFHRRPEWLPARPTPLVPT
jgi:hypothetical protein